MPYLTKILASRLLIVLIGAAGGFVLAEYPDIYSEFCAPIMEQN